MHDQAIRFQKFCAFLRQPEQPDVFTDAGKIFSALPFMLNPQKVNHVRLRQHILDLIGNFHAEFFELARNEGARADQRHVRAELKQAKDVRARDPTEQNVPDDGHV